MSKTDITDCPLLFIDTAGLDVSELVTPDEESKGNEGTCHVYIYCIANLLIVHHSLRITSTIRPFQFVND